MNELECFTDERLMTMWQEGSSAAAKEAAFNELHARHEARLLHYIANQLHRQAPSLVGEAVDILQDVFAWIQKYRGRFIPGTTVLQWLFSTSQRLTLNHIKHEFCPRRDRRRTVPVAPPHDAHGYGEGPPEEEPMGGHGRRPDEGEWLAVAPPEPLDLLIRTETAERCLALLSPGDQEIMRFHYYDHLSAQQIGHIKHVSTTTVEWRIRENLARIRAALKADALDHHETT
jgi:RNA polymerase sigma factor (sigma-70 family)